MKYKVAIKTGFFETTLYDLSIMDGSILLVPAEDPANNSISIAEDDFASILFYKGNHSEIEITTRDRTISAIVDECLDLREIYQEFKKNIKTKMIYEEE